MIRPTHIKKKIPYVVIYVDDLERSRRFYSELLGLRVRDFPLSSHMGEHALALSIQGTTIILMSKKAGEVYFGDVLGVATPEPGHSFPAWQVADLAVFHGEALVNGVECLQPPKDDVFGTVAYYRDPDGLVFAVVQPKPTEDTQAIVLSGGGALGAFELGVLRALAQQGLPVPAVITGTSVGGYNAAVLACELGGGQTVVRAVDTICQIWLNKIAGGFHDNGVFRFRYDLRRPFAPSVSTARVVGEMLADTGFFAGDSFQRIVHVVSNRSSPLGKRLAETVDVSTVFSTGPLRSLMESSLDFDKLEQSPTALKLATTEWRTGKLRLFTHIPQHARRHKHRVEEEALNAANFTDAVMASTAIPGVFPAIEIKDKPYADGGLVMNSPLNPAIESGARTLHLICVNPDVAELPFCGVDNTIETLTRALVAAVSGFMSNDLDQVKLVNRIAGIVRRKHSDDFYESVTVHRYHPKIGNLGGLTGLLDFSPRHIEALIADGETCAANHDCEKAGCIIPA
jgi:predicted acylesterase/phospholipase RssA/catechol 2,3-dioxygenase-like lactoylglutathione lyase family enzyme